ncbi:MAG: hypothetical protein HYZ37_15915 [Candidatus Solibacter usitatus]|nr:hypothetical protein [Candidatus Solibacter usitatus]
MTDVEALHTAARRHCRARYDECWEEFRNLELSLSRHGIGFWKTNEFTPAELGIYPRLQVLWAILKDVERLDPKDWGTEAGIRESLKNSGWNARDEMIDSLPQELSHAAMQEERIRFIEYIDSLSKRSRLRRIAPLPFRRLLDEGNVRHLWKEIEDRWGSALDWYPRGGGHPPPGRMTFDTDYFDREKRDALRRILSAHGIERLWELRGALGWEIELDSFLPLAKRSVGSDLLYDTGSEVCWTWSGNEWLVYVSHDPAITLAGEWLVQEWTAPVIREAELKSRAI